MVLYWILYILVWPVFHLFYRIETKGRENIPEGAALVCGNHTSLADPILIGLELKNKNGYHYPLFFAKAEIKKLPVLCLIIAPLVVYVNRGKADLQAIKTAIGKLKSGRKLVIFPEGTRVDEGDAGEAKTGVAMMAMKSAVPLLPVYVTSGKKRFRRRVEIIYGTPYLPERDETLSTSANYRRVADELMEKIYALQPAGL